MNSRSFSSRHRCPRHVRTTRAWALVALAWLLVSVMVAPARAQHAAPMSLTLARELTLAEEARRRAPGPRALPTPVADQEAPARARRARLVIGAGSGMLAAGLNQMVLAKSVSCSDDRPLSAAVAASSGTIAVTGALMLTLGIVRLVEERRFHAPRASTGQVLGALGLALGTLATSGALLGAIWAGSNAAACAS